MQVVFYLTFGVVLVCTTSKWKLASYMTSWNCWCFLFPHVALAAMSQICVICGGKRVRNCIKGFQGLLTSFFRPGNIVGLDNTVYLIYFQVAVELVLLSCVFSTSCFILYLWNFLWNGLFLAYAKVECEFPAEPVLFNLGSYLQCQSWIVWYVSG